MTITGTNNGILNKNNLIDAMDKLSNCADVDSTWTQAINLITDQGVDALTVGKIDRRSRSLLWARSSMSQAWLDEYVEQEYYECDPFLDVFSSDETQISAHAASLTSNDNVTQNEVSLNHGLHDAGYSSLHGAKFGNPNDTTGRLVTLCFSNSEKDFNSFTDMDGLAGLSSLIAAFIQAPQTPQDKGYLATGKSMLSQREREVLTLLASGLQTARISEKLGITETTVTKHFATARRKLDASTREQALFIAMRRGLIAL